MRSMAKAALLSWAMLAALCGMARAADPFGVEARRVGRDGRDLLSVTLSVPSGHYLYADQVAVKAESGGISLSPVTAPAIKRKPDPLSGEVVGVYDHTVTFEYDVRGAAGGEARITVAYQGCNDSLCFLPVTRTVSVPAGQAAAGPAAPVAPAPQAEPEPPTVAATPLETAPATPWRELAAGFTITGRTSGALRSAPFIRFLDESLAAQSLGKDPLQSLLDQRGLWVAILVILLGGLALNLTPCVLPMIPINLAIIGAGTQSGRRLRGFMLGGAYGLGIALVYGILGLVVVLTGAKFGALNASPGFNFGIAVLFVVLALAMFDVYSIDLSRFQGRGGAGSSGGMLMALALGGVAALLAGACVAPVVISVLILAADFAGRGQPAGLLLPFLLGVGMALPWPFAGAGLSFLPKPGGWMVKVKMAFGVLILAFAAYYGWLGYTLVRPATGDVPAETSEETFWEPSLERGLTEAQRTGRPVLIDFWATWCKNCKTMDRTTFQDPKVRVKLGDYVRIKYQAEDPTEPGTKVVMDYFGVEGLPTYVVLKPVKRGGAE